MKRIILFLLTLIIVFLCASCGESTLDNVGTDSGSEEENSDEGSSSGDDSSDDSSGDGSTMSAADAVAKDAENLAITFAGSDTLSSVTADLILPVSGSNGSVITWSSSHPSVITIDGMVTRPPYTQSNAIVVMTATVSKEDASQTVTFRLTVLVVPQTDSQAVADDAANLVINYQEGDSADEVTRDVTLPTSGLCGSDITWLSDDESVVATDGTVTRPSYSSGDVVVGLTAVVTKGESSEALNYSITVIKAPQTDEEAVAEDRDALDSTDITFTSPDNASSVTSNFTLPTAGSNGTSITWSEKTDIGDNVVLTGTANATALVTWPESAGFGPYTVTLTATISKGTANAAKDILVCIVPSATIKIRATGDGVIFKMVLVPEGLSFKTGFDDNGDTNGDNVGDTESTAGITTPYWIGETEITYELWSRVYNWATDSARGVNIYSFANPGLLGRGLGGSEQQPVTDVNWRDTLIWCNAMTEWYNAQNSTNLECVYYSDSGYTNVIRDSQDGSYGGTIDVTAGSFDNPYIKTDAKGFRLPTALEWSCAARYKGSDYTYGAYEYPELSGYYWTPGDYASGDIAPFETSSTIGDYAIYSSNSDYLTWDVKSKAPNGLGLYDMSGNVREWNLEWHPGYTPVMRSQRGGGYGHNNYWMQLGPLDRGYPNMGYPSTGFRFARNQ